MKKLIRVLKRDYFSRWQLYLLLLIPLIYIIIFAYIPIVGAQIAFRRYDLVGGISGSPWVGFENFKRFINSYNFSNIVFNTFILSFYELAFTFPLTIALALTINALPFRRYKKIFQTFSIMPYFFSTVIVVGMLIQLFSSRMGAVGAIYMWLTGTTMADILGNPNVFRHLFVWSGIWQNLGWHSIIFLAALTAVNKELSEAAEIDGASRFKRVLYVDLPSIKSTIIIMLILNSGRIISVGFEKVYLMQNRLNLSQSEVLSTFVYKTAMSIGVGDFSLATAIGLFSSIINFFLLVLINFIAGKLSDTRLW